MALTTCPECGGKISTIAESCIHCGCKITVCPECGMTFTGEQSLCSECGYSFGSNNCSQQQNNGNNNCNNNQSNNTYESVANPSLISEAVSFCDTEAIIPPKSEVKKEKADTNNIQSVKEVIDNWRKDTSLVGYYVFNVFSIISLVHGIPLLIAAVILLFTSNIILAMVCWTISLFFFGFSVFFSHCQESIANKKLWDWSKEKNINLQLIIDKELFVNVESMSNSDQKKYRENMKLLINALCYNTIPLSKAKEIWMELLSIIANTISMTLFTVFLSINYSVILTSIFDFELYGGWLLLIVAIILELFNSLIFEKADKNADKAIDEWMKKNLSSKAYTRYEAHVK